MPTFKAIDQESVVRLKIGYNGNILVSNIQPVLQYSEFAAEIKDLCKFSDCQPFTVKWLDEEGDPCTISSQRELDEAIRLFDVNKDTEINVHVFPDIPERPGMLCAGEDRKFYHTVLLSLSKQLHRRFSRVAPLVKSLEGNMYRRGARRWRKLYVYNGHHYQARRFSHRAVCGVCADRIWGLGRQGFKCTCCKVTIHKRCHKMYKPLCGMPMGVERGFPLDSEKSSSDPESIGVSSHGCSKVTTVVYDMGNDSSKVECPEVEGTLGICDFQLLHVIGRGSYAKVLQVEHKRTKRIYAMKVIKKELVNDDEDIEWVQTEKHVFEIASNYPFLVGLHSCFQSESRLFFVIEFVNGGDMMFHMQRQRRLPEEHARFYSAEICLALHFLHCRGVVYRDLKLDNVLLDAEGHIKLTDYGMCKEGLWYGEKTNTFCGTPNYIAPEVLRGEDYDFSVDWWALGVLMFEMLAGRSPFDVVGNADNPDQNTEDYLFQVILEKTIRMPRSVSVKAASILKGFLNKVPAERLGCNLDTGFCDIQSHAFFRPLDWAQLEQKQIPSPYKPLIRSERDLDHFDPAFTDEPVQLTPDDAKTISEIDQSEFEGFEYINPLLMSMEDCV